ncbi:hypothetical protein [Dyella tabacisoli]|uniref:DUF883 family protein n=1 Tax=Dyella tabacisoli TaxID=2282381 RepID=A0A369UIL4_9GAMM|nr:hypothetical protein [Dyella tabacisoli]RDD80347.1 hypothetical protein DVJ77_18040 [Dyella tabacisoli]
MARHRDIEESNGSGERIGERVRSYADGAAGRANELLQRSREARRLFGQRGRDYSRQLANAAEDFADEANYRYNRLRRQARRHPVATAAIVAGAVGAALLLFSVLRSRDND